MGRALKAICRLDAPEFADSWLLSTHLSQDSLWVRAQDSGVLQIKKAAETLPAYERQRGRKAAPGERRVALPSPEFLGGVPVGCDESEVGTPELAADGQACGMDGWSGGSLGLGWLALGTLGEDGRGAEGLDSGALPVGGGFPLDFRDQRGGLFLPLLRRQVLPAGKRIELQGFASRILEGAELFPTAASEILLGAIEPPALEGFPLHQSLDAVDSGPFLKTSDQSFLAAVGKQLRLHVVKIWPV